MTFKQALEKLNGRESRKLENNTYLERIDVDRVAVRLHRTYVVEIREGGAYRLNSGGWRTATTKDRINKYAPCRLSQVRGAWIIRHGGEDMPFADGMILDTATH